MSSNDLRLYAWLAGCLLNVALSGSHQLFSFLGWPLMKTNWLPHNATVWSWHFYVNLCSLIHATPSPLTFPFWPLSATHSENVGKQRGQRRITKGLQPGSVLWRWPTRKFGNEWLNTRDILSASHSCICSRSVKCLAPFQGVTWRYIGNDSLGGCLKSTWNLVGEIVQ